MTLVLLVTDDPRRWAGALGPILPPRGRLLVVSAAAEAAEGSRDLRIAAGASTAAAPGEIHLSELLAGLANAGHRCHLVLARRGEIDLLEDCHLRGSLRTLLSVSVRWHLPEEQASWHREALLQEACKGHVRLRDM